MALNFRVVTDFSGGLIRVDFQRKVGSIGFTLQEAIVFRELWDKHVEALQKMQHRKDDNGRGDQ